MATYPTWTAGQRITAALLLAAQPATYYKAATTSRSSMTTLADDPDLTVTLDASATYTIEMVLSYAALTAAGFQTAWSVSAGVTSVNRSVDGPGSSAADASADNISMRSGVHNYATAVSCGTRNSGSNQLVAVERALVTTDTTGGTVTLQWAQATSNATATLLSVSSYMTVTRIA